MCRDSLPVPESVAESSVMASIDESADGSRLVIADLACDESWLAAPLEIGLQLSECR